MSRRRSEVHRPNGPYLPVGDLGGEYCVRCRTAWPCPESEAVGIPTAKNTNGGNSVSDINRKVHEFYAKGNGYFWLPCPFPGCGRMFGGHEYGAYSIRDNDNPNSGSMTCKLHDKFARQVFNLRFPGVEYWSSDGSFHYTGDVESDLRLVRAVSEFRQLAQCTHEDMNCPPGECEDLYPPNREDAGR